MTKELVEKLHAVEMMSMELHILEQIHMFNIRTYGKKHKVTINFDNVFYLPSKKRLKYAESTFTPEERDYITQTIQTQNEQISDNSEPQMDNIAEQDEQPTEQSLESDIQEPSENN